MFIPTALSTRMGYGIFAYQDRMREMPAEQQPYLVVAFTLLDYVILDHAKTEAEAEKLALYWQRVPPKLRESGLLGGARRKINWLPFTTWGCTEHDIQVRTQASLDSLVAAIHAAA